jgi:hypothetical protein
LEKIFNYICNLCDRPLFVISTPDIFINGCVSRSMTILYKFSSVMNKPFISSHDF